MQNGLCLLVISHWSLVTGHWEKLAITNILLLFRITND